MNKQLLITICNLFLACTLFAQQGPFTFIHVSDLHVATQPSSVNTCDLNGVMAKCYLRDFNAMSPKPAFILATGDISNIGNCSCDAGGMYSALTQYLYPKNLSYPAPGSLFIDSAQTIPFYFAPGNHDYYTTLLPPGTLTQLNNLPTFAKYISPDTDYAVTTDISVILFVRSGNDISYLISTDPKASGLTDAQCSWIRTVLAANSTKRKIIVMHHPSANLTGTKCDGTTASSIRDSATATIYVNRITFQNICDSNNVDVVLAGHSHQNVVVDKDGNLIDENCTTCGTRYVQTGPAFAGCYRTITVDPNFVTVGIPMLATCDTTVAAGLDFMDKDLDLSVYPDPSNGIFNLRMAQTLPVSLKIYNVLGQCVHQQKGISSNFQIDLQSQSEGIYFLQVIVEQGQPTTYNFQYPLVVKR